MDPYLKKCSDAPKGNGTLRMADCCKIPAFYTTAESLEMCGNKCYNETYPDTLGCCRDICILTEIGFLIYSTDPNVMPQTDPRGLVYAYMLSVNNDPVWEPVVRSSVTRCFDDARGLEEDSGYHCGVIPFSLAIIHYCSILELFSKCPYWNPEELSECDKMREWIRECETIFSEVSGGAFEGEIVS